MIKTIKWEFLKGYYRLRWIVLFSVGAFGVVLMLSLLGAFNNTNTFNGYMLNGISFLFLALTLLFCVLLPSGNMLIDYILPHKYMEKIVHRKSGTIIIAKLIVNAVIFYIGIGLEVLVNLVFKEIISDGEKYFLVSGDNGSDIFLFMIFGIFIPIILLFFYMMTYYIKAQIKHRILLMLVLMVIAFCGIYLISKVALLSKVFEFGGFIVIIMIMTNLINIIENKYEPR